jgi:alpha-mannosidase
MTISDDTRIRHGRRTGADTKAYVLDMIGNAHLDPVWLWQWQEGYQEAKATFRSVLNLMREYEDFLFTSSSAAIYEWVESNDPEMFEEIRQRIAEGRWEMVGGWWIQPDCNIPSGESFVRQGLYGQRYFKEHLGVSSTVGYNVDSFGHAASLPQILRKSGMAAYVFTRPMPHEARLPRLFEWESDDGSRVLAFRIPYEYTSWGKDLRLYVERTMAELRGGLDELMCFYGVGNHGGGPTRENIESIRALNADPAFPTLRFSTPSRYFRTVRERDIPAPTVHNELQQHAVGCYAAHSGVKRWNRQAETALVTAEKLSTLAERVTGLPYPGDFARAWKDVLFNQFHDILAGTSIEPAYEDARNAYGEALAIAGRNQNGAIQALTWRIGIDAAEGTRAFVVFNPHSWPVRAAVELEFGRVRPADVLLDSSGARVPFQTVSSEATVASGSRTRLSFVADLPAFGYEVYRMTAGEGAAEDSVLPADLRSIENRFFRLEVDPETGWITSLYDKRLAFEWVRRPAARPVVLEDRSDTWSHGVTRYDTVRGEFVADSIRLLEHGPVKSVLRVESSFESSRITQDIALYAQLEHIEVTVTVDWREHFAMLKLSFPINLFFSNATFEIPYGVIERPANGNEVPGQSWVDLTGIGRNDGRRLGMSLLNDGKYSYSVVEHEIDLTVLRSPIYAHHDPYVPTPDGVYSFVDQGRQQFTYWLVPHAAGWKEAETPKRAAELNQRPIAQAETAHPGPLPQRDAYIQVDGDGVVVSALKRAEDGGGVILRCYETNGDGAAARIALGAWNRVIETDLGPTEIKTYFVPDDESQPVREVNLVEWDEPSTL